MPTIETLRSLRENNRQTRLRVAVAAAADAEVLAAVRPGLEMGLDFVLVGTADTLPMAKEAGLSSSDFEFIPAEDRQSAAQIAVSLIREKRAQILMKGFLGTADLLRPVLDRERGLRAGGLLSHVAVLELRESQESRLLLITDAGINIAPSLAEKVEIIRNAAGVARRLGINRPRVAVLAALELINPAMPLTIEAAALAKMADRGQLQGIAVDGPLALDNALSAKAADRKGIGGEVAGKADILLAPEIVCANVLYKALVHVGNLPAAGVVAGASVPIVMTSRADSWETRLNSLALAAALCRGEETEVS